MQFSKISLITAMTGYLLVGNFASFAAPPEGADMSLAPWYNSLKVPDNGTRSANLICCSLADCRPVRYHAVGDHFEALVTSATFPNQYAPDGWIVIPNEVIIKQIDNPTGEGVLCLYNGEVRCFVPASGT